MKDKSETAQTFDEHIEAERVHINRAAMIRLVGFSERVRAKLAEPGAVAIPALVEGGERLMRALERGNAEGIRDPLPSAVAEAGVAIQYLLKGMDLIPDSVPGLGFLDDAALIAKVIDRNPEFHDPAWRNS